MPHRVHAAVNRVEPSFPDPFSNRVLTQPHLPQLIQRDHTVLIPRTSRDRSFPLAPRSPKVTFRAHWALKVAFGRESPLALG